ncbi:hypothetical protein [Halobaculum lipolyticum]|uniref:Uncharacterized protein n=1 Tax=Halobaculum lipolyticum TaxID=3032001 RepID=A0ABD5WBJ0_9EURY|nr:hypothetical protein [Halobaculum sp. DT31]
MTLDTTAEVDKIEAVRDRNGDARPAADADKQEQIRDAVGNRDELTQFVYSTSGTTAETLDSNAVPDGVTVLVEFKSDNTGTVYVGSPDTQESALTGIGQGRSFDVSDTAAIGVRTPTAGDAVVVTFESAGGA